VVEQCRRRDAEAAGDANDHREPRVSPPALQQRDLGSVQARGRAKRFLGEAKALPVVLGSDNGSAFTARRFKAKLAYLGIRHRRGGYRDPESQAFIESWFGKLKEREVCGARRDPWRRAGVGGDRERGVRLGRGRAVCVTIASCVKRSG